MSSQTSSGGPLGYDDVGTGRAVLALHGAGSARQEIRGFLDPMVPGCRIVYPDLPGHGDSTAVRVESTRDAVDRLADLVGDVLGDEPFVVVGHSFGAHVARGLAARLPGQVRGLALICPMVPDDHHPEPRVVVEDDGAAASLPPDLVEGYTGYFVVHTAATLARFHAAVAPVLDTFDGEAIDRMMSSSDLELAADYPAPVLVMTARHDSWVGYRQHVGLLEAYPRATSVVVADAGHALPHERPELVGAALADWLSAVGAARR